MIAAIQTASDGRSASVMSASRREESAMTSHVSAAPTTSPTISSHQLNSAFTVGPPAIARGGESCGGQYRSDRCGIDAADRTLRSHDRHHS
jgi:hypothetical protein